MTFDRVMTANGFWVRTLPEENSQQLNAVSLACLIASQLLTRLLWILMQILSLCLCWIVRQKTGFW